MSRTRWRPAQDGAHVARACGAAMVVLVAACSDPTVGPHVQAAAPTSGVAATIVVAPHGRIGGTGTADAPLSLARAVAMAPAGTTIRLAAGEYQTAGLTIDRPMTIEATPGATVTLKGSTVIPADQWEPAGRGWRTPWTAAAVTPSTARSPSVAATATSMSFTGSTGTSTAATVIEPEVVLQDNLAIDGHALTAATTSEAIGAGSFYIDPVGKWLYVGQDPAVHTIEAGHADVGIVVTAPHVSIIGVNVREFSQIGLRIGGSFGMIDHSSFSYNRVIGLDINGASHLTVQNSSFRYNGQVGIEASHSSNVMVQNNNISFNNTRHYNVNQAAAGIKGTDVSNFTVRKNYVDGNASNAIWFDVNSRNITVSGNQALRNKCYAIYFELSNGALIVGNQVHDNVQAGIGVHFTANARIYNNTLVNNGTDMDVSAAYRRSPYDLSHAVVVNNIFWSAGGVMLNLYRYNGCNSYVYREIDYNAYYRPYGSRARNIINWCTRRYSSVRSFHSGTGHEAHGIEHDGGRGPFFVNVSGADYRLYSDSEARGRGQGLPTDAALELGVTPWQSVNMGAVQ
jgi:parallel beta-helix repeat protein